MFAAWCGIEMRTPAARSASTVAPSRMSEPVTRKPASTKSLAMPLIPAPPIPTKCTLPSSSGTCWEKSDLIIVTNLLRWCGEGFPHKPEKPVGSVAHSSGDAACSHLRKGSTVLQQGHEHPSDPVRGELRVVDGDRAAGIRHGAGIQPLLSVPDGERHVGRWDPQRGEFADRRRPCPGDDEVGGRKGKVHPVAVLQLAVAAQF